MSGHVFMSQELESRVKEVDLAADNTILISSDNGKNTFVSEYHSFFVSPGVVSIDGRIPQDIPHWIFDKLKLGKKVNFNIILNTTTIKRVAKLSNISINNEEKLWNITGEILNSGDAL